MFAPGVPQVMRDFHEDSVDLASFVVSVYVLGYAMGPLIMCVLKYPFPLQILRYSNVTNQHGRAPMSEVYGRLYVYHLNTFLFSVFNLACGRSTSLPMLIVFRFLAGVAGSCSITVGSGTIADTFRQDQRGKVMSIWMFPILFGPR